LFRHVALVLIEEFVLSHQLFQFNLCLLTDELSKLFEDDLPKRVQTSFGTAVHVTAFEQLGQNHLSIYSVIQERISREVRLERKLVAALLRLVNLIVVAKTSL
jgi:hypothetical protein